MQTRNQRPYVFRDQGIPNANHQSYGRAQKWNGVDKSGNHTNGYGNPGGNSKQDQSQYEGHADEKTFRQCPSQIVADSVIESVKDREGQLKVAIRDETDEKAANLSVIETEKDKNQRRQHPRRQLTLQACAFLCRRLTRGRCSWSRARRLICRRLFRNYVF